MTYQMFKLRMVSVLVSRINKARYRYMAAQVPWVWALTVIQKIINAFGQDMWICDMWIVECVT